MGNKLKILKEYLHYKHLDFKDRDTLSHYQEKQIQKQLNFLTKHSSFYKSYQGKPLSEYPMMDKASMMEHFNELNTVSIDRDEALSFAIESERTREFAPKLGSITVGLSSGTSDMRGAFLISEQEQSQWAGYILSKVLYGSILNSYKVAFFMRADSNLYEAVRSKTIQFQFFDIFRPMSENLEHLKDFRPDILIGQPSVLLTICDAMKNSHFSLHPKKVISIAEVLEEADRKELEQGFQISPIHQVYQCTEGCLATTCSYGTIHLNEDIVHFDKEYLDDRRFIPIITDFTRRSQPIIRYRLNDILVERKTPCPCGSCFTALEKIEGREDDVFLFESRNGNKVQVFPDFIRRILLFAGNMHNYRVVQSQTGNVIVYSNEGEPCKQRILSEFQKLADELDFYLPEVSFQEYYYDPCKKLKRVESHAITYSLQKKER